MTNPITMIMQACMQENKPITSAFSCPTKIKGVNEITWHDHYTVYGC